MGGRLSRPRDFLFVFGVFDLFGAVSVADFVHREFVLVLLGNFKGECPRLFVRTVEESQFFELCFVSIPVEHPEPRPAKFDIYVEIDDRVDDLAEVVGDLGLLLLGVGGSVCFLMRKFNALVS